MALYPEEIIEEIRIRTDIYELISEYVKLEKKGKYYFGLCPFHKEKTPSFSVTPEKQIFHCYGCGESGNSIHFIMKIENLDFVEAVKFLADRAKITLPEGSNSPEELKKIKLKEELLKLNVEVAKYYRSVLNSEKGVKALEYLRKRGLSNRTINSFGLGYSPENWDDLLKYLKNQGFAENVIYESGLVIKKDEKHCYDRFRGRLMFPIFDIRGRIIGFGGRVLDDSLPKYMNSPETLLYSKSRSLYALNFAKNSGKKTMIVVEGYMDAISLHQNGITNAVASLGTALTESQGRLLKKYSEDIVIAYDADTAGQAATLRGLEILNDIGCNVRVLTIPQGKDPDEFLKNKGKDDFLKLVDNALSLVEYRVKVIREKTDVESVQGKIEFLNRSADILSRVANDVEREVYIKKISKETGVAPESMYSEVIKRMKPRQGTKVRQINSQMKPEAVSINISGGKNPGNPSPAENLLIWFLCRDRKYYEKIFENINIEDFSSEHLRNIARIIVERMENNKDVIFGEILNLLNKKEEIQIFTNIINEDYSFDDEDKALNDALGKIKVIKIDRRIEEILSIINSNNERDVEKLNGELSSLIIEKKKIQSRSLR